MRLPQFLSFVFIALLFSCETAIKEQAVSNKETPEQIIVPEEPIHYTITKNKTVYELNDIFGYWVGWFEPEEEQDYEDYTKAGEHAVWNNQNKITISIDTIRNDSVIGHSIVAGNFRPFKGTYNKENNFFFFTASEPGDDKYDGAFSFSLELNRKTLEGKWVANKKIKISKRKYKLTKKPFEYYAKNKIRYGFVDWMKAKTKKVDFYKEGDWEDMEAYFTTTEKILTLNPSVDLLTEDEVSNLTKADIYVLRNSIYAKHGYSFKKRQLRVFFDSHDWYMPVHINIKKELTETEKQNIKLLLRYEKYAEEYYDVFGRG